MKRSTANPFAALAAMLSVLALSAGLDWWILFLRELNSRTASYNQLILVSYTLAHLLLAVLLLALFAWMVLRTHSSKWTAWIFLLVGLVISAYPALYFTPVGPLYSRHLTNIIGARSFLITAGAFIAVIGAAALVQNRQRKAASQAQGELR